MKTVLFDVDGVLVHGYHARAEYRRCWDEHIERDFGIDRQRLRDEFILGPFTMQVLTGRRDLAHALGEYLPILGYDENPQAFIEYWLEKDSNINHGLFEYIERLKKSGRFRLYIATNQEHNRARYLMDNMGFNRWFDDIFHSARLGVLKPHPDYFAAIENCLGLESADKPVFFDDTPDVVRGAFTAGWEAYEFLKPDDLLRCEIIRSVISEELKVG